MTRKNKFALLAVGASSVALAAYLLQPHSTMGNWESTKCDVKLSVYKDKTAIHENGWAKNSCEWSAKDECLIVLKCRMAYTSSDYNQTFQTNRGKAGILDDKVLIRVDPNHASCPKIGS